MFMYVFSGFEYEREFYKIGDEIAVILYDGTHYDGTLEDIRVDEREIVVNSLVFNLDTIDKVLRLN